MRQRLDFIESVIKTEQFGFVAGSAYFLAKEAKELDAMIMKRLKAKGESQ